MFHAGLYAGVWRAIAASLAERIPIPKRDFEIILPSGAKYFDTKEKAQGLIRQGDGEWAGAKSVRHKPDTSKRGVWKPVESGYPGPTVMQLT